MRYDRNRGLFTKSYVRTKAMERGYRLASLSSATRTGSFAEVWVWGWDESAGNIKTCRFYVCRQHPEGDCPFPPVSDTKFAKGGVQANQLGLPLDYKGSGGES